MHEKDKEAVQAGLRHEILYLGDVDLSLYRAGPDDGRPIWLIHGFPECWYSWRHQIPVLAAAGYQLLIPELRGYGRSSAPDAVGAYAMSALCGDVQRAMDILRHDRAAIIGHDWGAMIAWNLALLEPGRVAALATISVPYGGRPKRPAIDLLAKAFADHFHYILYFQEPGVAEAELDADIAGSLRRIMFGKGANDVLLQDKPADLRLFEGVGEMPPFPDWCGEADFTAYVEAFARGFRGPLNIYRNFARNWAWSEPLAGRQVLQPALFLLGEDDPVGRIEAVALDRQPSLVSDLEYHRLPDCGHWSQNESPAAVNRLLVDFLVRKFPACGEPRRLPVTDRRIA